jgi:hypothetical protein
MGISLDRTVFQHGIGNALCLAAWDGDVDRLVMLLNTSGQERFNGPPIIMPERVIREAKGEAQRRVECRRGSADGTWRDVRYRFIVRTASRTHCFEPGGVSLLLFCRTRLKVTSVQKNLKSHCHTPERRGVTDT